MEEETVTAAPAPKAGHLPCHICKAPDGLRAIYASRVTTILQCTECKKLQCTECKNSFEIQNYVPKETPAEPETTAPEEATAPPEPTGEPETTDGSPSTEPTGEPSEAGTGSEGTESGDGAEHATTGTEEGGGEAPGGESMEMPAVTEAPTMAPAMAVKTPAAKKGKPGKPGTGKPSKGGSGGEEATGAASGGPKTDEPFRDAEWGSGGEAKQEATPDTDLDITDISPAQADTLRVETFYRKIGSVMIDNKFDRPVSGQRSGKLVSRSLHKVVTGNTRVFSKTLERSNKEYNVVILVDESGSMSQYVEAPAEPRSGYAYAMNPDGTPMTRIQMVADLARLLVKGLDKHNIDFSVVGFGQSQRIHKDWGYVKDFNTDVLYKKIIAGQKASCCNHDMWGVLKAQELLKSRTHGHNIVLILADGGIGICGCKIKYPKIGESVDACSGARGDEDYLHAACKDLARQADIITIGIDSEDVKSWYPNCHIVQTREEFMSAILGEFSRLIKRG